MKSDLEAIFPSQREKKKEGFIKLLADAIYVLVKFSNLSPLVTIISP